VWAVLDRGQEFVVGPRVQLIVIIRAVVASVTALDQLRGLNGGALLFAGVEYSGYEGCLHVTDGHDLGSIADPT